MATPRSPKNLAAAYCEPASPPPYWWRRAEENRQTMTLTLTADRPEDLRPGDLIVDDDETQPSLKPVEASGRS
jgi:hypothetical protein